MNAWARRRRLVAPIIAAAAATTLCMGASAASAAAPPRLPAQVQALLAPRSSTPTVAATLTLYTAPVTVTVNGTSYKMTVTATKTLGSFAGPPIVDVLLQRSVSTSTGPAEQDHDYTFSPSSGFTFTANTTTLATAALDSGSSINPSAITMTYAASIAQDHTRCTLANGNTGYVRQTPGTVSVSAFSVVSGTAPFFGTITTQPQTASLVYDPGCAFQLGQPPKVPPCGGRESIQSIGLITSSSFEAFVADVGFGGTHATQIAVDGTITNSSVTHAVFAVTSSADLPPAAHWATGAGATWNTTGNPFMSGQDHFTSHTAPIIRTDKACTYERHTYHFDSWRYGGTLTQITSPLTALFDTGGLSITGKTATLTVRRFLT
jgi:hypothetical protein